MPPFSFFFFFKFLYIAFFKEKFSKLVQKPTPKERWKKKSDHSRLVGDRFNMQENLHMDSWKTSRSLSSHARILKVYMEALTEFIHIYHSDGLSNTLLFQDHVLFFLNINLFILIGGLKQLLVWEWWMESIFQGQRRKWRDFDCWA